MNLLDRLRGQQEQRSLGISTVDDYLAALNEFTFGVQQTLSGTSEPVGGDFPALARQAHAANGVVFAVMAVRQLVFSTIRFRWQRLRNGQPSTMFGDPSLAILEQPWFGGTTQDLLARVIQDADLAGNSFTTTDTPLTRVGGDGGTEMVRLRPDWIDVAVEPRMRRGGQLGWRKLGYAYTEGGRSSGNEPVPLLRDEVAHFAPLPDPLASFRGMSWLTPIIREIQADLTMTTHKRKFFENGATPNMVVKHDVAADEAKVRRFAEWLDERHAGVSNAYRTLHLYPGADATVVGSDFEQIDFRAVQGAGETRIAAAGGIPPVIVGLSEGLQAATYSNYGQARRRLGDGTAHPLWQNLAGSIAPLLPTPPPGVRLWYDASGVPFLREDEKDAAEIAETKARTIRTLIDGGYTPESVVAAVSASDWSLLVHTGLFSIQLQAPGAQVPTTTGEVDAT